MNNNVRLVIAVLGACALAALATPQLIAYLPDGMSQVLAVIIGAGLHKLDSQQQPPADGAQ